MTVLITYTSGNMNKAAYLCTRSAIKNNVLRALQFDPSAMTHEFKRNNAWVLNQSRGAGFWLWKPYIINNAIQMLKEDDILIYSDAGIEIIGNVNHIIDRMREPIFFFTNGFSQIDWCKADCLVKIIPERLSVKATFEKMIYAPGSIAGAQQVQASVIFFRVNSFTRQFVKEWLLWCQMPGLIDDSPSVEENCPTFRDHRHDQAILTCLQIKYNFGLHFWPVKPFENQRHRWPKDDYPTIFNHHRKRDNEFA